MALKGNLRDFTVTQLLNLINLAQKTGTLVVEGPAEMILVSFRDGKLTYAQTGQEDNSLATILYRTNKINATQHRVIKERAGNMNDKELGLLLINANYINQQDILASLQNHFVGIVNRLFTWMEGLFRFDANLLPPEDKITVRIGLENLIIEGSRRLQEWEHLQDEIPSLDMALKFADRPGTNIRNVNLSVEEWRVVSFINPKNSIRQIARATKLNDLEIRRIVYALLEAGLVEIIRPAPQISQPPVPQVAQPALAAVEQSPVTSPQGRASKTTAQPEPQPQQNKREQVSLINRLIRKIRSL